MKIIELFEASKKKGTFAGARFDDDSKKILAKFIKDNELPNPIKADKLHCTLIYSKAHIPEFEVIGEYSDPIICKPTKFVVWETQPDEDGNTSNCLVLKLDAPDFVDRHNELMDKHPEATHGHKKFKVHVTLSYDIGGLKVADLPDIKQTLRLKTEYTKPLDSGWAKKNTNKSKT